MSPPRGSTFETRYLAFPLITPMTTQSLESGFAMKIGALLGRTYTKGRDRYDFIWHVGKKILTDLELLSRSMLIDAEMAEVADARDLKSSREEFGDFS